MFDALIALLGAPIPLIFCIAGLTFGAIGTSGHIRHHNIDSVQQFFAGITGFILFSIGMIMLFPPIIGSSFLATVSSLKNSSIIAVFSLVAIVFAYIAIVGGTGYTTVAPGSIKISSTFFVLFISTVVFVQIIAPAFFTRHETIQVPFVLGTKGIQTQQSYRGIITINISGTGQAERKEMSDAFYIYTDRSGRMIKPWHPQTWDNFTLWINGKPADYLISIPRPTLDHTYSFQMNAPGGKLTFAVGDKNTKDNTGSYTITILSY